MSVTIDPAWLGSYGAGDSWEEGRYELLRLWRDAENTLRFDYNCESRSNHGYNLSTAAGVVIGVSAAAINVEVRSESKSGSEDTSEGSGHSESTTPRRSEITIARMQDGKPVLVFGIEPMFYLVRRAPKTGTMRLRAVPDLPDGAVRCYGSGSAPPEGAARRLGSWGDTEISVGATTLAMYRARGLRALVHVDGEFHATCAAGIVFIACNRGGVAEIVRWDCQRAALDSIARLAGAVYHLGTNADATKVVVHQARSLVVLDGESGKPLWSRTMNEVRVLDDDGDELEIPLHEVAIDGDAVIVYFQSYDPYEPGYTLGTARVTASGPIASRHGWPSTLSAAPWYSPPSLALGENRPFTAERETLLAIARDGSRVATPVNAWTVPGGDAVSVRALQDWYGCSSWSSAGIFAPVALAYDAEGELLRVSTGRDDWCLETCHTDSPPVDLPRTTRLAAIIPGTRHVVIATANEVRRTLRAV